MRTKNLVKEFYTTDFGDNAEKFEQYLHPEAQLYWNNSGGFRKMNFKDIAEMLEKFSKSFLSLRADTSHLLKDKNTVTIRFTYYVRTIENPEEELPIVHFIAIWEIKNEKLYKGYQISQQADDSPENLDSYLSI